MYPPLDGYKSLVMKISEKLFSMAFLSLLPLICIMLLLEGLSPVGGRRQGWGEEGSEKEESEKGKERGGE